MAQASGKVILAGEHAVVYGGTALALGIEQGVLAVATPSDTPRLTFGEAPASDSDTRLAYEQLLSRLDAPPMATSVTLQLPHGVGLGASAAVAVAVARAVRDAQLQRTGDNIAESAEESELILAAANAWEAVFHGNPSGIDTACAVARGCIRFVKGRGWSRVHAPSGVEFVVAVAGPPSPTREMVAAVARIRERNPSRFADNLAAIETLVRNAELCLVNDDRNGLGALLNHNHMLLAGWLLSTPEIETAVRAAREAGALGAKLTGAGGGGCVLALPARGGAEAVLDAWRALGLYCFSTQLGALESAPRLT